jgi:catechol 2,3-dioxygenase-like lactoylglutathione lyase family enzyme
LLISAAERGLPAVNHLALVCSDMACTVHFSSNVLVMKLIKSLDPPGGAGQHFLFIGAGNGDCVAFFWSAAAGRAGAQPRRE